MQTTLLPNEQTTETGDAEWAAIGRNAARLVAALQNTGGHLVLRERTAGNPLDRDAKTVLATEGTNGLRQRLQDGHNLLLALPKHRISFRFDADTVAADVRTDGAPGFATSHWAVPSGAELDTDELTDWFAGYFAS